MTLHADYSFLSVAAECARRFYYKFERGLSSREPAVPLHAGSAGHAGVYELHVNGWDLDRALAAMHRSWGDFKTPINSKWSWLTPGHMELVLANYKEDREHDALQPLRMRLDDINLKRWALDSTLTLDDEGYVVFAEQPIAVSFDDFVYAGKIDLPATIGSTPYVCDFKFTSSWLTEFWASRYAYSHQMRGYVLLMQELTGRKFAGVYINGVYMGKEAGDEKEKWKRRTSSRSALFGPYLYSAQMLEETKAWVREHLKLIEFYKENELWPQNDKACQFCEFKSICHTTPPLREGRIRQDFVTRELTGVLASGADSDD